MSCPNSVSIKDAVSAVKKGNLPLADIICRTLIRNGIRHTVVYEVLAHISHLVKRYDMALYYLQCAIDIDSFNTSTMSTITEISNLLEQERDQTKPGDYYLLIKAWGYGFWSDVDHVLGQLLIAEITGRTPVVKWSNNSLFSDGSCMNAFEFYFEPVSDVQIDDLINAKFSFFPPKWSARNLHKDNVNKFYGKYSRMAGLYYVNRPENVLVSDFHTSVYDLIHWIPSDHHLYGLDCETIYRYLYAKYLIIKPAIRSEIEKFWQESLAGKNCLAVHIRGSDKLIESRNLANINVAYHKTIKKYLRKEPDLTIFLLTDYKPYLDEYRARYPGKIISTKCTRTDTNIGTHNQSRNNKVRIGIEVMKDAYLAAMCKYFIGNGHSNVSTSILHMKEWNEDDYALVTNNGLYESHLVLHDR